MTNRIYTHNTGSRSSTLLKQLMRTKQLKNHRPAVSATHFINWGNGVTPEWDHHHLNWLNHPSLVGKHTNKLSFFSQIASQNKALFLEYTTNPDIARQLLSAGHRLYARNILNGHGGEGISVLGSRDQINAQTKLWTLKENISREFRVLATNFSDQVEILSIQEKKKEDGWRENLNFSREIRSENTGWAFCEYEEEQETSARLRFVVDQYFQLDNTLDFGGFDIAITEDGLVKIIEVNTAPGLGEVNGQLLANALSSWAGEASTSYADAVNLIRG